MLKKRKEDGFTLIELMIVIAVIGILAVVLIPKVGGIKNSAKSSGVDVNVRSIEAFVQSRINYWSGNSTTQAEIGTEIYNNNNVDPIKNPLSTQTAVTQGSGIGATGPGTTPAATDALQLLSTAPTTPYATGHGTVVVVIPSSLSSGIVITGYDNVGNVTSSNTVTP